MPTTAQWLLEYVQHLQLNTTKNALIAFGCGFNASPSRNECATALMPRQHFCLSTSNIYKNRMLYNRKTDVFASPTPKTPASTSHQNQYARNGITRIDHHACGLWLDTIRQSKYYVHVRTNMERMLTNCTHARHINLFAAHSGASTARIRVLSARVWPISSASSSAAQHGIASHLHLYWHHKHTNISGTVYAVGACARPFAHPSEPGHALPDWPLPVLLIEPTDLNWFF